MAQAPRPLTGDKVSTINKHPR